MSGHASGNEVSAGSQGVQDVLNVENALDEALLQADIAALDTLLSQEATRTTPSGIMTTRTEWLEEIQSAVRATGRRYLSIEREAQQVRLYGETAVVRGLVHILGSRGRPDGQPNTNRYLRVYVHRQGRWQLVAHQATRVASP